MFHFVFQVDTSGHTFMVSVPVPAASKGPGVGLAAMGLMVISLA
jgi:hypothetical protein